MLLFVLLEISLITKAKDKRRMFRMFRLVAVVVVFLWTTKSAEAEESDSQRVKPPYTEAQRQAQYIARGHSFPLNKYNPDTPGWEAVMKRRFRQVQANKDSQQKWDGFMQTLSAALTVNNFTEYGWGLTHAPEELTEEIRKEIYEGLPNARPEGDVDVIHGKLAPLMIDRPRLTRKAMRELQPILEAWSGIDLVPSMAYGFRLYRNESRLWMHVDRTQTHVISCIYHIASSDDSEPWPIVIEGYDGRTNSVVLKPGDILLYESSKNFHGRPTQLIGSWYTSLFVHYRPADPDWDRHNHDLDSHYAIPPNWMVTPEDPSPYPELKVVGTSMLEPTCEDFWCALADADHYEGPGEYGKVLTGGGKKYSLFDAGNDEL